MAVLKCDKGSAKMLFIQVMNGGAKKRVMNSGSPMLIDFYRELYTIRKAVMDREPELKDEARKRAAKKSEPINPGEPFNISGIGLNLRLCEMENRCLMAMYDMLTALDIEVGSLVFDGLMIRKASHVNLIELLPRLNAHVHKSTGIAVSIVHKEMDEGFNIPQEELTRIVIPDSLAQPIPFDLVPPSKQFVAILEDEEGVGVARVFAARTRQYIKYHSDRKKYYAWTRESLIWQEQDEDQVSLLIRPVIGECVYRLATAKQKEVTKIINSTSTRSLMAHIRAHLSKDTDAFFRGLDASTHCLPIAGGLLVDLKTGTQRQRTCDDLFTFETTNVLLDPDHPLTDAECYIYDLCKDQGSTPDVLKAGLLKMCIGYLFTGETNLKIMIFLLGPPDCGKSKLAELIMELLGPRAGKGRTSLIAGNPRQQNDDPNAHTAGKMVLEGKFMVFVSETRKDKNLHLLIDKVNEIVGDAGIIVRGTHEKERVIVNTCKVLGTFNSMPPFAPEDSDAINGKIKAIRLNHIYDKMDKDSIAFIAKMKTPAFRSEVFTLAVRCAKTFYDNGQTFDIYDTSEVLDEYMSSPFFQFSKEAVVFKPRDDPTLKDAYIPAGELFTGFQLFCTLRNLAHGLSEKQFALSLNKHCDKASNKRVGDAKKVTSCRFGVSWNAQSYWDKIKVQPDLTPTAMRVRESLNIMPSLCDAIEVIKVLEEEEVDENEEHGEVEG